MGRGLCAGGTAYGTVSIRKRNWWNYSCCVVWCGLCCGLIFTFMPLFLKYFSLTHDTHFSPLLPGDSELDQVHRIFSLLGTPSPRIWPDMAALSTFAPSPRHSSEGHTQTETQQSEPPFRLNLVQELKRHPFSNLQAVFPCPAKIGEHGLECLNAMLTFDPKQRITVRIMFVTLLCFLLFINRLCYCLICYSLFSARYAGTYFLY